MSKIFTKDVEITKAMVYAFGAATGDFNPIHYNEDGIIHGMLTGGLISSAVVDCFGEGTIYIRQDLKFTHPVKIGDTVTITINNFIPYQENRINFNVTVFVEKQTVAIGMGTVLNEQFDIDH